MGFLLVTVVPLRFTLEIIWVWPSKKVTRVSTQRGCETHAWRNGLDESDLAIRMGFAELAFEARPAFAS